MEKITFVTDDGGKEEFYVEEQTRINGVNYILVSDSKDDEANAYILKDISTDTDAEAEYVVVEDDTEFDAVSGVFASMLDDEAERDRDSALKGKSCRCGTCSISLK